MTTAPDAQPPRTRYVHTTAKPWDTWPTRGYSAGDDKDPAPARITMPDAADRKAVSFALLCAFPAMRQRITEANRNGSAAYVELLDSTLNRMLDLYDELADADADRWQTVALASLVTDDASGAQL